MDGVVAPDEAFLCSANTPTAVPGSALLVFLPLPLQDLKRVYSSTEDVSYSACYYRCRAYFMLPWLFRAWLTHRFEFDAF